MKAKIITFIFLLSIIFSINAQTSSAKGYIIGIENGQVYLDYSNKDVKVGDRVKVFADPIVFTHPVTKQKIVKNGDLISTLEITETAKDYSVSGKIYPTTSIAQLKVGQKVEISTDTTKAELPKDGKINVAIAKATVNDVVGIGYFGNYVADLLMTELLDCDKIRLIDRSLLESQVGEVDLAKAGYINQESSVQKGQIAGVQYMIQVSMQKPDVTNLATGIPIKSIITAAGTVAGAVSGTSGITNALQVGGSVTSNVKTARLKASVSISARVVDMQTGEVLFMCNGSGTSQGEGQLSMEEGALGGLQVNGGVEGFRQTITGKAIEQAYGKIGNELKNYFSGNTTERVVKNASSGTEMTLRHGAPYMGVNKLSTDDMKDLLSNTPELFFQYKKGKNLKGWSYVPMCIGIPIAITGFLGTISDYNWIKENNSHVGQEGYVDYSYISYNMVTYDALISIGATALAGFGIYMHIKGNKLIKNTVNTYNQNIKKQSSITPELNFGLSGKGLALTVRF